MTQQRTTGSGARLHEEDQVEPVGAGPAPVQAVKGAAAGILVSAVVGAVLGAPFGLIEWASIAVITRVLICAAVGATALSVVGMLVGAWVGAGASATRHDRHR